MIKEHFLLLAGKDTWSKVGTETAVLEDGDFFKIKNAIAEADRTADKKVTVVMFHTHPRGFENFSNADMDTMTGMRLGLDRDFISIVVLPKKVLSACVLLSGKTVRINTDFHFNKIMRFFHGLYIEAAFRKHLKRLRYLTYGA